MGRMVGQQCKKVIQDKDSSIVHTYGSIKKSDGTVKALTVKQVADLLGHSTTQVTEMYYVKKDTARLNGITNGFNL